jgi:hypothetical protein
MLAALRLFDGVIGTPGLSWTTETTSGLYRAGVGDFRWAVAGVDVFNISGTGAGSQIYSLSGTDPRLRVNETDAAANNRLWDIAAVGEQLRFRLANDADNTFVDWLEIDRTLNVVDSIVFPALGQVSVGAAISGLGTTTNSLSISGLPRIYWREAAAAADARVWRQYVSGSAMIFGILNDAINVEVEWLRVTRAVGAVSTTNFGNGTLQYGGVEVGYRGFRQRRSVSGGTSTDTSDPGGILEYTGSGGGDTITLDTDVPTNGIVTIINTNTANPVTIAASGTLSWMNGAGAAMPTGNRTLARSGAATVYHTGSGNFLIWGTGLS